jgi:hypothetical protein
MIAKTVFRGSLFNQVFGGQQALGSAEAAK